MLYDISAKECIRARARVWYERERKRERASPISGRLETLMGLKTRLRRFVAPNYTIRNYEVDLGPEAILPRNCL